MDLQLVPATADDIPGIVQCACRAFADDALEHAIFPQANAPPGSNPNAAFRAERMAKHLQAPAWRYVVAVVPSPDAAAPRIAGYAAWKAPLPSTEQQQAPSAAGDITFPAGMDMEAAEYANDVIEEAKKETLGVEENDVWYLSSLAVDPDFRGKGIASKLVKWGLDQADQAGKAAYLESSPAAVGVYRRMGFQELGTLCIIKDHPSHRVTLMKRAPITRDV